MPPDNAKASPARKRKQLSEEEQRDIETKRLRGELSCAECRRLKLLCDKKVPCASCVRRGCESICPLGTLSAGQGTRFILAGTDKLHAKIAEMSHRIRQLEDGLAITQSSVSTDRHPLLDDNLLKIKFGSEVLQKIKQEDEPEPADPLIDTLGTLTLNDEGDVKYFGRSGGSETLMLAGEDLSALLDPGSPSDDVPSDSDGPQDLPQEVIELANRHPFARHNSSVRYLPIIQSFLPHNTHANRLCRSYIEHAALFFRPIKSDDLFGTFLPAIYSSETPTAHALATCFLLLAVGCLLDVHTAPYSAEAERYYHLGRAALAVRSLYDSPETWTVVGVGLLATYHALADKQYSRESAWTIMSMASKLAQSMGLHRDSSPWNMDSKVIQQRRNLFWEVFAADVSNCLALGRPPAIHLSYVDCEYPFDQEATLNPAGEPESGFWRMKHTYARDVFMPVIGVTLSARPQPYAAVLDLDKRVRGIDFPTSFRPYVTLAEAGPAEFHSSALSLMGFYASQHRTVTMLYLHRSFFAQALLDHPSNPLASPFALSFQTALRCASIIIKGAAHHFERCESIAVRCWFLLGHVFSAAVIVATVATRSPTTQLAAAGMRDLTLAIQLFERSASHSQRARIALNVLRKLSEKASRAVDSEDKSKGKGTSSDLSTMFNKQQDADDELAIFGGQAKILSCKGKKSPAAQDRASKSSSSRSSSAGLETAPRPLQISTDWSDMASAGFNDGAQRRKSDEFRQQAYASGVSAAMSDVRGLSSGNSALNPTYSPNSTYSPSNSQNPFAAGPSSMPSGRRPSASYPSQPPLEQLRMHSPVHDWGTPTLPDAWRDRPYVPPLQTLSHTHAQGTQPHSPAHTLPPLHTQLPPHSRQHSFSHTMPPPSHPYALPGMDAAHSQPPSPYTTHRMTMFHPSQAPFGDPMGAPAPASLLTSTTQAQSIDPPWTSLMRECAFGDCDISHPGLSVPEYRAAQ
ncbi:fungal-specific transcription factor domain-containing protein [Schizophyllum amplum]|uniref:Fungal-specific transcription factor domain-containing protein n=1 Tax=Schizophyllum amplum TaxID=97359 RepID=A0A550CZ42_9AGAR|nr:fungal-specific transcription factor domain-containing protein [Auriculariopsis ampla]